ncbi:MAG TPA: GNAT family N-acetyltransferase [Lacipirellulaceae bacterium]|nr:GNAT family N-acetyltransferase [Lacipirellulaceae bacterium]
MTDQAPGADDLTFHPLTPDRWPDFERLFGPRGACGGCWCMWWRLKRAEFEQRKGEGNRRAMQAIVDSGDVPGLLAYVAGEPAAWCAVGPRDDYPVLERSRVLKRVDDEPVWSVVCLFVARPFRRRGVSVRLLGAALEHAREQGARIVEGYPVEPKTDCMPDAFAWTGTVSAFTGAGFREVLRRSPTRPIMRFDLLAAAPAAADPLNR